MRDGGQAFGSVLSDLTTKSSSYLAKTYGGTFGTDIITAKQQLFQTGDARQALLTLINSQQFSNLLNSSSGMFNETAEVLGANPTLVNIGRYFQSDKSNSFIKKLDESLDNMKTITDSDVESYVEQNAQVTLLEQIQNKLSLLTNGIDWRLTTSLATAAFGLIIAGQFTKALGSLISSGKDVHSLNAGTSKVGSALGGLATGAAVVGLTATTISALASINNRIQDEAFSNQYQENLNSLQGTANAGNTSLASALTIASSTNSTSDFGKSMSNVTSGFSHLFTTMTTSDKKSLNRATTDWMYRSGILEDAKTVMAWAVLLDMVDSLDSMNVITGANFNRKDIKDYLMSDLAEEHDVFGNINSILKAGWHPARDNSGNRLENFEQFRSSWKYYQDELNGYHKAGKNLIPKDNYHALLHKGEMVLNEREANRYRRMLGKGGSLNSADSDYVGPHHAGYAGHNGIDLYFDEIGTPVGSAVAGTVIESRDILWDGKPDGKYHGEDTNGTAYSSYGRMVKVLGDDGHSYIYAHLNERVANVGDEVGPGTLLGYSGTTGNSSGPHLHFEVVGAGTGEAAHAAYYTPYVRNVTGSSFSSTSTSSNLSALKNTLGSRRYISKALSGSGGADDGANRIVGSVDGGFNRLISYLDSIAREQNEQRALLETYSLSKAGSNFN